MNQIKSKFDWDISSLRISLSSSVKERIIVEFGKSNIINKARKQTYKVKELIDETLIDGLFLTLDAPRRKLY